MENIKNVFLEPFINIGGTKNESVIVNLCRACAYNEQYPKVWKSFKEGRKYVAVASDEIMSRKFTYDPISGSITLTDPNSGDDYSKSIHKLAAKEFLDKYKILDLFFEQN